MESRGRQLVRTVTLGKRGRSLSRSSSLPAKRAPLYRGVKLRGPKTYSFVRSTSIAFAVNPANGFTGSASDYGIGINYQLSTIVLNGPASTATIPSSAEFIALFDSWRIKKVDLEFYFSANSASTGSANAILPVSWICNDPSDSTRPADAATIQQKEGVKTFQPVAGQVTRWTVRPRPASAVYQSGAFSGYSEDIANPWLSTAFPAVENYATKIYMQPARTASNDVGTMQIFFKVHFEFKGVQ